MAIRATRTDIKETGSEGQLGEPNDDDTPQPELALVEGISSYFGGYARGPPQPGDTAARPAIRLSHLLSCAKPARRPRLATYVPTGHPRPDREIRPQARLTAWQACDQFARI